MQDGIYPDDDPYDPLHTDVLYDLTQYIKIKDEFNEGEKVIHGSVAVPFYQVEHGRAFHQQGQEQKWSEQPQIGVVLPLKINTQAGKETDKNA